MDDWDDGWVPNRILRDWTDSYRVEALSAEAERMFVRLIMKVDDFGRFHADLRLVSAACFPLLRVRDKSIESWLSEIAEAGLVELYEAGGRNYLAIKDFRQRLRLNRAKFPPPDGQPDDWSPSNDGHMTVNGRSYDGHVPVKRPLESESESEVESEEKKSAPPAKPQATPRPRFAKPTPAEATEYAKSIGYHLDGQAFVDSYEAKGWLIGKTPMKDWKAAVRTWKSRDSQTGTPAPRKPAGPTPQVLRNAHYRAVRYIVAAGREARAATDAPGDWERWRAAAWDKYRDNRAALKEALDILAGDGLSLTAQAKDQA